MVANNFLSKYHVTFPSYVDYNNELFCKDPHHIPSQSTLKNRIQIFFLKNKKLRMESGYKNMKSIVVNLRFNMYIKSFLYSKHTVTNFPSLTSHCHPLCLISPTCGLQFIQTI